MAVVIDTDALVKNSKEIVAKAILSGDTLNKQLLTIIPNVKPGGINVQKGTVTSPLEEWACNFNDNGDVDISPRLLTVTKMMTGLEYCIDTLYQSYLSDEMSGEFLGMQTPKTFQDFVIERIQKNVALQVERLIWQGDTLSGDASLALFDGFLKKMLADADVLDQAINAVTTANIFAELSKVLLKIPAELQESYDSLTWYCSYNVTSTWRLAQTANNVIQNWGQGVRPLDFNGFKMEPIAGLPANTIVVAQKPNLQFGTNLLSDMNRIDILDMTKSTLDRKIRMRLDALAGVQYGFGEEIVLAKTA